MHHTFQDGAIISEGRFFEKTQFHVSNESVSACFDSTGAVTYLAESDANQLIDACQCHYYIGNEHIDVLSQRTVRMLGRRQTASIYTSKVTIYSELFLDKALSGVFLRFWTESRQKDVSIEVAYCMASLKKVKMLSDTPLIREPENSAYYFFIPAGPDGITLFLTGIDFDETSFHVTERFLSSRKALAQELCGIQIPEGLDELDKAMFLSCYYCALENYKEKGEFKAFMAGHHYLLPMRSYYRDSYYTVLPMYRDHTDKIRNQIITLAMGIEPDGTCPSAVRSDYTAWWGNHYDSPSFLAIMLHDYIKHTQDLTFLQAPINNVTILEKAEAALNKLSAFADNTGLLYKDGVFNKRDWADEVNRYGYVTYDELLYARAWFCLASLSRMAGKPKQADAYLAKYEQVKHAINLYLWDDALGYYINFKNTDYTEANLSIDTVFAAIWGIADESRAISMLKNMERILECRNNTSVSLEDFGVMSVYPLYKGAHSAYRKSADPFNYHNGANWPYLSAMYAYAKRKYGMEYRYALGSWFPYNIERCNYTPVEYFSPVCADGSFLQAWNATVAFVLDRELSMHFWD